MRNSEMISVIVPFHDEKENLPVLIPSLETALKELGTSYEIILVDDGSLDNYRDVLQPHLSATVKLVVMNRQMGKGKALTDGIQSSTGDIIVFMDADLQDDPGDLKAFFTKLTREGYDLVNGHRFDRKDNAVIKIYSKIAGYFLRNHLNSPFSDINCGFKMFRRTILDDVSLYGNNFRFLPLAAFYEGYKV
ncbi:glycosyltransferase family 2 protein, partial [Candidatus Woesebacteria bacterium]|nr:glycosyltransferase family 2 protein [Candidatus Woesebacteria bacterium]